MCTKSTIHGSLHKVPYKGIYISFTHNWASLVTQMVKKQQQQQQKPTCNAGDPGLIPGLGRSPGEGNGYPLQYFCLGNPMDRGYSPWGGKESDMTEPLTLGRERDQALCLFGPPRGSLLLSLGRIQPSPLPLRWQGGFRWLQALVPNTRGKGMGVTELQSPYCGSSALPERQVYMHGLVCVYTTGHLPSGRKYK